MQNPTIGIGILAISLLRLLAIAQCQCPEYFRYFRNDTTGEIMGTVEIPSPPRGIALHLKVILSVPTVLPTEYVGRLELAKSKDESIRVVLQGMPLYYRIYFPCQNPIPQVTSLELNNVQFCIGPPAVGMIVTSIILEHTLFPPRVIIPLTEQLLNFISDHTDESTTSLEPIAQTTTTTMPLYTDSFHVPKPKPLDFSCGVISGSNILNGEESSSPTTSPIAWPWLAAIFIIKDDALEFICTGNIISREHILTAANCLKSGDDSVSSEKLFVSLGRFNLRSRTDPTILNVDVADYKFHPDFDDSNTPDADLAIVRLVKRIDYTPTIRPICLWIGRTSIESVVGKFGYAVGWSNADKKNKRQPFEPRMSVVPIVAQQECLQSNETWYSRIFCTGTREGTNHCENSDGSGLFAFHEGYGRYHLRGIISLSLTKQRRKFCDPKDYAVYVDVAKYIRWIKREMISFASY